MITISVVSLMVALDATILVPVLPVRHTLSSLCHIPRSSMASLRFGEFLTNIYRSRRHLLSSLEAQLPMPSGPAHHTS